MRSSHTHILCALALLTLTAAKAGHPTQEVQPVEAIPVQGQLVPAEETAKERPSLVSPGLMADMNAAKAELDERLATLTAELDATRDPARAIELQRQIQQAKVDNELRYFEIQAQHARKVGNLALAEAAEKFLNLMKHGTDSPETKESVE